MLTYEGIILENPFLKEEWSIAEIRRRKSSLTSGKSYEFREEYDETLGDVPQGITPGVPAEVYNAYRRGRDSACVDIVIVTQRPDGTPAVLLSLRKPNVCFGGKWWIYGGALQAYRSIHDFISERASTECGVTVEPEALIGVYRTIAEDHIGSTMQPCYVSRVPFASAVQKMTTDTGHSAILLFTERELAEIPKQERHWYPMRVARLALQNMPMA